MSNGFEDSDAREVQSAGLGTRAMVDHRPPTVSEKLLQEKKELELRLEAINQLIAQMDANPETRDIIDKLAQLGRGMF
jgi:predicted component of type VI protein secretion system